MDDTPDTPDHSEEAWAKDCADKSTALQVIMVAMTAGAVFQLLDAMPRIDKDNGCHKLLALINGFLSAFGLTIEIFEYLDQCIGKVDSDLDPELGIASILIILATLMNWLVFFLHLFTPCPPESYGDDTDPSDKDDVEQRLLDKEQNPTSPSQES